MNQYSQDFNIKDFKDLQVWQKSAQVNHEIFLLSKGFPNCERYELTSQLLMASSSVPANISEGNGQLYPKKEVTHYNVALGSCAETRNWIYIAMQRNYITQAEHDSMSLKLIEIVRMLHGCIKKLNIQISNIE